MKVLSKYFIYGFQVIALVSIVCSYAIEFLRKFSYTGTSKSAAKRVSTSALCRSLVKYSTRGVTVGEGGDAAPVWSQAHLADFPPMGFCRYI